MKLSDFNPLLPAEARLAAWLQAGNRGACVIGDALPPSPPPEDRIIRAGLIRHLALGGCDACRPPATGVRVAGAHILGDDTLGDQIRGLDFEGASLTGDLALLACRIPDTILFRSARVHSLFLHRAHLEKAFVGDRMRVEGTVSLRETRIDGAVRLLGARLRGDLFCTKAELRAPGEALSADGMQAEGGVFLKEAKVHGEVRLLGARLGGNLSCAKAELRARDKALSADGMQAGGGVFLEGAKVDGTVRLLGARLGGDLSCTNAELRGRKDALSADRMQAEGNVFLDGTKIAGTVRLTGARLGGSLSCRKTVLRAPDMALSADRMQVDGSISLVRTTISGAVRLLGAQIGGNLSCISAQLLSKTQALSLDSAQVTGTFFLRNQTRVAGKIDMAAATFGTITDDLACWPDEVILDRCRYGAFTGASPTDAKSRLKWLARQQPQRYGADFWPDPYEHCARVLREMGHGTEARTILIEKERLQRKTRRARLRRAGQAPLAGILALTDALLGMTTRYGRQPLWAFAWLVFLWLLGTAAFDTVHRLGEIKPNLPQIQRAAEWVDCADGGPRRQDAHRHQLACFEAQPEARSYPGFNAAFYAADTLFPVVSLDVQSYWIPDDRKPFGRYARWYLWFHILTGWALTLLAVAGFSGLIKTDTR